ncbi:hypothetical protein [Paenibacillus alkalitolerans]|uniref:hypothetical protein n=1 Tax=Paenibacillus alkalitolerans TaxID=2799335 RepID=UPI0018F67281|nr:hypothetical protein [Paenibacillus alkalitolerans]
MMKWINDLFNKKVVIVHITSDPGESFKSQQKLQKAGIKFTQEIENQGSTTSQAYFGGNVQPIMKLRVSAVDEYKAREALKT